MNRIELDGVEVCSSSLTQSAHKAAYCDFLLPVTTDNFETAVGEFRRVGEFGPYRGLRVSGPVDLSFLQEFPSLLYLEIVDHPRADTSHLAGLENLRGLRLETPGAGIDFEWFPELEVFVGDWHAKNRNVHGCRELRQLRILKFRPSSGDLTSLSQVARLERLELTQTNVASLAGVETLEDLRYFKIAYASKLESLEALAMSPSAIRELEIDKAKSIQSYQSLASLPYLRRLRLSASAPMPSLDWVVDGFDRLDFFSFVDTNVEDGCLSPLLELPRLQYIGTLDRRHYDHKCEALNAALAERSSN